MTTAWNKPLPTVAGETKAFWDSCRRGQLVIQYCEGCDEYQWYPRGICADCWGESVRWVQSSGRGTVWTYTVTYQNRTPGFAEMVPYVLALVELGGGRSDVHQHRRMQPPGRVHRYARGGHLPDCHPADHHPLLQTGRISKTAGMPTMKSNVYHVHFLDHQLPEGDQDKMQFAQGVCR